MLMVKDSLNPALRKKTKLHKDPMFLEGLRAIGKYMNVAPVTVLRWHRSFGDVSYAFPLIPRFTGVGAGFKYVTHTELILLWMERLSRRSAIEQKSNLRRPRKRKVVRMGETRAVNLIELGR